MKAQTLKIVLAITICFCSLVKVQTINAQTNLYNGFNPGFEGINSSATGNTPYYWWNFYNEAASAATLTDETNPTNIHSGAHAAKVVVATAAANYQPQLAGQPVNLDPTHTYRVTAWVKSVNGVGKIQACNGGQAPYLTITTATTSWSQYTATFTGESSFNTWFNLGGAIETFYIDDVELVDLTVLPVNITAFSATTRGSFVDLIWQTTNEVNNDYFNVEKSFNAVDFSSIGKVSANTSNSYTFTDAAKSIAPTIFYRLAQVDKDGKTTHSNILSVSNNNALVGISASAYPNPALGKAINVKITSAGNKTVALQLTDVTGKIVATKTVNIATGFNIVTIENNLQHGVYNLQVIDNATKAIAGQIKIVK